MVNGLSLIQILFGIGDWSPTLLKSTNLKGNASSPVVYREYPNLLKVGDEESIQKLLPGKSFTFLGKHPTGKYPGYDGWYTREIGGSDQMKIMLGRPAGVEVVKP